MKIMHKMAREPGEGELVLLLLLLRKTENARGQRELTWEEGLEDLRRW